MHTCARTLNVLYPPGRKTLPDGLGGCKNPGGLYGVGGACVGGLNGTFRCEPTGNAWLAPCREPLWNDCGETVRVRRNGA